MFPAILRQRHDPDYYLRRPLPPTARPYLDDSRRGNSRLGAA
jgi:hypothetical protein